MRMLNPDGSISIMDLSYREAQRICKMLGLRATGKHDDLEERLYDYEEERGITLKVFVYTIVKPPVALSQPNEQSNSTKEYSYKVLEIENKK